MKVMTSNGFEGTIGAIDTERGRATLQLGQMTADVALDELLPAGSELPRTPTRGRPAPIRPVNPTSGRRGEFGDGPNVRPGPTVRTADDPPSHRVGRPRATVPRRRREWQSHPAWTCEARVSKRQPTRWISTSIRPRWPESDRVTVIHGHGSGALRDAVRDLLSGHPLVREWRPGERGEGGDGATIVTL